MIFELWIFPPVLCVGKRSELGAEVSLQSSQIRTWLSPPIKQSMPQAGYLLAQHFYCAPLCICHCGPWKCRATAATARGALCGHLFIFSSSFLLEWVPLMVQAFGAWQAFCQGSLAKQTLPIFSFYFASQRAYLVGASPNTDRNRQVKIFLKKDKFQHTYIWIKLFSCCNYSFPH